MIRKAYVFQLKPGCAAEYTRRHNPIWANLEALLKKQGAHNYSIFHHETTGQLFAYVEIEDEARWAAIGETALARSWGEHMADVMSIQPDGKPVAAALHEVFHLP
jgi:L-rhamnose mutarotase